MAVTPGHTPQISIAIQSAFTVCFAGLAYGRVGLNA